MKPTDRTTNSGTKAVAVRDKARKALELRRAGAGLEAIARQVGYSNASAARKAILKELQATAQEPADDVRAMELERLDRLQLAWWQAAIGGKVVQGEPAPPDPEATRIVLSIQDRRARYLGLDAPQKQELSGPGGAPVPLAVLEARAKQIYGEPEPTPEPTP